MAEAEETLWARLLLAGLGAMAVGAATVVPAEERAVATP